MAYGYYRQQWPKRQPRTKATPEQIEFLQAHAAGNEFLTSMLENARGKGLTPNMVAAVEKWQARVAANAAKPPVDPEIIAWLESQCRDEIAKGGRNADNVSWFLKMYDAAKANDLSDGMMAAILRLKARNTSAQLPEVKSKITFDGQIVKVDETDGSYGPMTVIDIHDASSGIDYRIKTGSTTKTLEALEAAYSLTVGTHVRIAGKVHYANAGLVIVIEPKAAVAA